MFEQSSQRGMWRGLGTNLRAALGLLVVLASCSEPARPKGVLFISVDSLRSDHLSSYGYESATNPGLKTTPNIDQRLVAEGTRYSQAMSTTSWTLPSHMAMLTGMPNTLHGVRSLGDRLHETHTTLAETFQKAGWRTHGIWSGPNLHPFYGFDRGFDEYVDCSTSEVSDATVFERPGGKSAEAMREQHGQLRDIFNDSHRGLTGPAIVEAFDSFVSGLGNEEPFFAFVHMWDVHYDYAAPAEFDLFDPDYTGSVTGKDVHDLHRRSPAPTARDMDHVRALYDAEIRFTDHNIGKMLSMLEAAGRLDDTLIVFTSDHGDEFMEHGAFGHNSTLYEEVVHVPMILRLPGTVPAGRVVDELVGIVDLAPTVLDLCGLAAPRAVWGRSLRGSFSGRLPERDAPLELTFLRGGRGANADVWEVQMRGLRAEDFKVVREVEDSPKRGTWFYDLKRDAGELEGRTVDEASTDPRVQRAISLWEEIDQRAENSERSTGGEMPAELIKALRSQGYIGDDD